MSPRSYADQPRSAEESVAERGSPKPDCSFNCSTILPASIRALTAAVAFASGAGTPGSALKPGDTGKSGTTKSTFSAFALASSVERFGPASGTGFDGTGATPAGADVVTVPGRSNAAGSSATYPRRARTLTPGLATFTEIDRYLPSNVPFDGVYPTT